MLYAHQAIAVVIAETLEAATEGVALLAPRYEVEQAVLGFDGETFEPEAIGPGMPPKAGTGDVGRRTHRRRQDQRDGLRDAAAVSQPVGAARHRRALGRR